ncbi:hypothetical protein [Streptomyces sp. GC420]|uniref:Rv1733c family protein n=1 Tax=Streptomyces sp. GC420 TaxID=2697568 RepID=UPI001414DD07|nr:hypothetical protein [Streptomyces sp. GC420]NBM19921.1 hypothetical protein [Streptomyces sp. GC420]
MGSRVGLWRFRRNELKRRSDTAEAWTYVAAAVLIAVAAPAAGAATAVAVEDASLRRGQDWHTVSAVLTKDAPPASRAGYAQAGQVRATVRWTAADGTERSGRALVSPGTEAGAKTTVWLDEGGALHDAPLSASDAEIEGIASGALAATGAALLVLGGALTVRVRLDRRREAEWEREWAQVGPQWGHHHA